MLLVIDAGNTNTIVAVFDRDSVRGKWRLSTDPKRTADEYALSLLRLMEMDSIDPNKITKAVIGSVVPQNVFDLSQFCKRVLDIEPQIIGKNTVVPMKVNIDNPEELGADRLVDAVAAKHRYGKNVIIIDFGTATTFDVIDGSGAYAGGVIAPGINLSIEALHMAAAQLPKVAVRKPDQVMGKNTVEAMQSGIYWGYVGLIEGLIDRLEAEQGAKMTVIATGGLASLFSKATDKIMHLEEDLTIWGLRLLAE